jgi:ATP-dependent DNA ligase
MPVLRLPEPFDHPDWLFEVKHDGFRALAHIDGHHCALVSLPSVSTRLMYVDHVQARGRDFFEVA